MPCFTSRIFLHTVKLVLLRLVCKTCLTLIFNLLLWRFTDMIKMKQCTLFLLQEATWAISNVTAGPKEQIQVKKIYISISECIKQSGCIYHTGTCCQLILFFYCGIGTCKKWTVTIVSREFWQLSCCSIWQIFHCTNVHLSSVSVKSFSLQVCLELVTISLLSANSQVL